MRAAFYERTGPPADVLTIGEVPAPMPGPGEVLVRIAVSGVNPHDTKARSGWTGRPMPAPRVIPHSDGAGTVVAVGEGVAARRIGERVWVFHAADSRPGAGAAAEFAVVHAEHASPLPDHVSFEVGACLGVPFMTAHEAVLRDGPVSGQTILVTGGAGAVAGYAIQLAKQGGARVIATISSPEKAAQARRLGADETIDYRNEDVAARVLALTDGRGVERIVEVDFGANLGTCQRVIRPHGVIAAYSSSRVREPVLPYYAFAPNGVTLHFVQGMLIRHQRAKPGIAELARLLSENRLQHPVAAVFPLSRIAQAQALLESGGAIGKVLVRSEG